MAEESRCRKKRKKKKSLPKKNQYEDHISLMLYLSPRYPTPLDVHVKCRSTYCDGISMWVGLRAMPVEYMASPIYFALCVSIKTFAKPLLTNKFKFMVNLYIFCLIFFFFYFKSIFKINICYTVCFKFSE